METEYKYNIKEKGINVTKDANEQNLTNLFYDKTSPKIICIGRNYKTHCEKRDVDTPTTPMFFFKPKSSLLISPQHICIPAKMEEELHYEVELAVLIGRKLKFANEEEAGDAIFGYDIGIDVTNRVIQNKERNEGYPWTLSKCVDGFAVLTGKIVNKKLIDLNNTMIWLSINDQKRQEANINEMIFSIPHLLSYISQYVTLYPGDIVFTGTPGETGKLLLGDNIKIGIDNFLFDETTQKKVRNNICECSFEVSKSELQ